MKLTVFRADKGDCLLLTSSNGTNILADGGMRDSYRQHVAPALGKLHQDGQVLDLVYLSHIDQDHIAGILQLVNDLVDWRVFRYQTTNGNPTFPTPGSPEPPAIRQIWHNAFHEQVGKNAGPIEEMLAANASILSADANFLDIAERSSDLATSMAEAVKLSRHIGARQLGIPLNPEYDRGLMYVADPADAIDIGDLSIWVIGPFAEDLAVLRRDWNTWLRSQRGKTALRRIRDQARPFSMRFQYSHGSPYFLRSHMS
ncbi:MAG: MBL fold metallo-hydrolase [Acidobacteriota bacterium]